MPGCHRLLKRMALPVLMAGCATQAGIVCSAADLPQADEYTISTNSDLVLLDVSVKDAAGGYATGLKRGNFQVFEDGRPRTITQFSSADVPVTVGLVLDNSGSMLMKRRDVIMAGLAFAADSNPKDEFFVLNFNDNLQYGLPPNLPFTDRIQKLHEALSFARPVGRTALYDAIASALQHLEKSTQNFRTLIVVSDGGDNVSHLKFSNLLRLVEASRATIYTVGLLDPEDRDLNPGVLKKLAGVTGGEYFQPEVPAQVVSIFKKISSDIRNRYIVGFVPDEAKDKKNVRTVKVQVTEEGHKLTARSRTTYSLNSTKDFVATSESKHVLR
jgi:Ca-activated chloride channel homolog